jgi:cell division septation protein DedD
MSQTIRQTITELETRAKQYEIGAAKSRQAAQQLRELLQLDAPTGSSVKVSAPPRAKKPTPQAKPQAKAAPVKKAKSRAKPKAKPVAKSTGKPTLKAAIAHVLETRQQKNAGGVKATQLYDEIHDAGYRFSGTNKKNNMTYLYKILRQNKSRFTNADGLFSLKG